MKKILVLLILLMLLLPATFCFNLWLLKQNLEETKNLLLTGDFSQAKTKAIQAQTRLGLLPFTDQIPPLKDWVELGETLSEISLHLAKTGELTEKIISVVLGREEGEIKPLSQEAKGELDLVWRELSLLEGELKKRPLVELPKIREKIEMGRECLGILPALLGETEKKSYLFLFQNNMELRATGGFIGSYGLAIFEHGKLLDFQVEDVYTADGQLKGYVEPPEPIKKYLGEPSWYLRDSNFDPDFSQTAKRVEWFFQKETGRAVDGVIGVNLFVAQKILRAIGPVKLPDYQETITADNLFERAEYHSETGFFPGSTQKSNFLGSLAAEIFQRINQTKTKDWFKIAQAVFESLEEKQILISLNDKRARQLISRYDWDGRIKEGSFDYLMIVESNFGVNKANYFLERTIHHQIELGEEIKEKLTIHYQNNSPSQAWPGGNYKNYLRIYTALGSQLLEASEQIDVSSASGKTVFGLLVEVPVFEEKEVIISYKLPFNLENLGSYYSLFFQKQSGIGQDPLTVSIHHPPGLKPTLVEPYALTGPQTILYNTDLTKDRFFRVEFEKNEETKT